jgi:hypothetical protein
MVVQLKQRILATSAGIAGLALILVADLFPLNGWGPYDSILVSRSYFGELTLPDVVAQALRPAAVLILLAVLMLVPLDTKWRAVALGAIAAAATVELFFFIAALVQVQEVFAFWVGLVGCLVVISTALQEIREHGAVALTPE